MHWRSFKGMWEWRITAEGEALEAVRRDEEANVEGRATAAAAARVAVDAIAAIACQKNCKTSKEVEKPQLNGFGIWIRRLTEMIVDEKLVDGWMISSCLCSFFVHGG